MQLIEFVKVNELLSVLNGRVSAAINRHLARKFKAAGLDITTEQWGVLVCLWEKDKQTQQSICDLTLKDKASITRLIDGLTRHGLVMRNSDPSDRRLNIIHLTEKGRILEEKAMSLVKAAFDQAVYGISHKDILFTRDILYKVLNNIK